ncbi:hypothetical protein AB0I28_24245 [Phytomonospora sp. NPDC050363]|uniref:hypothetical protein n=1 Tax=Phytomonospora sp. NPDC050363 TaxID=3155642 RepID=UPI0033E6A945
MTYPQQPDEESSEDTQAIRRRQQAQQDPVSPFGPAPDPQQAAPQPVDPFAPPSYGPPPQYQQPAQPQYQQEQYRQQQQSSQYPQQPPANPAEPPTVPNQWGPQQPAVYVPQNPPVYTPPEHQGYTPPVSGPPAYQQPVSAPPSQPVYQPPGQPTYPPQGEQVSAPPAYTPPVSGPPAYQQPVSAPPSQPVYPPHSQQVSSPPAYQQPVSAPPSQPVYPPQSGQVSGPPAHTRQPYPGQVSGRFPVSAPPVSGAPVSGMPVSAQPVSGHPVSGQPLYAPQQVSGPPSHYQSGPDPQLFAAKHPPVEGPTYTGTQPSPPPPPNRFGGAPVGRSKRGIPKAVLIVSVVIVVVALGVGAVLFFNTGGTPSADPSADPGASQDSQPGEGTGPAPLTAVLNENTRLEYLTAGAPWVAMASPPASYNEITTASGEFKEGIPGLPALFMTGGLDTALIPYAGPAKIGEAAQALATALDGGRYVGADAKPLKGLKREAAPTVQNARIDGRVAVILRYHVVWSDPAMAATGDTVYLALIDVDGSRTAVAYAAVPDSEPDLKQSVEDRLLTLHFNM